MKTTIDKKAKQTKPDITKVATRKAKQVSNKDLELGFGIWEGKNITLEQIREKTWSRK